MNYQTEKKANKYEGDGRIWETNPGPLSYGN